VSSALSNAPRRWACDALPSPSKMASTALRSWAPGLALVRLAQGRVGAAVAAIRRVVGATAGPRLRTRLLPAYVEILLAGGEVAEARAASDAPPERENRRSAREQHPGKAERPLAGGRDRLRVRARARLIPSVPCAENHPSPWHGMGGSPDVDGAPQSYACHWSKGSPCRMRFTSLRAPSLLGGERVRASGARATAPRG
jgi:hypothetical protein